MFQWNNRIATVFIVSAAIATTAAAQPSITRRRSASRGGPALQLRASRSACPSRSAHRARRRATGIGAKTAPQMAAPRAAPHIAAPRHAPPQGRAACSATTQRAAPGSWPAPRRPPPRPWHDTRRRREPRRPTQQQPQTAGRGGRVERDSPNRPSLAAHRCRAPIPTPAPRDVGAAARALRQQRTSDAMGPAANLNPQAPATEPSNGRQPRGLSGGVLRNRLLPTSPPLAIPTRACWRARRSKAASSTAMAAAFWLALDRDRLGRPAVLP